MENLVSANAKFIKGDLVGAAELYRELAHAGDLDAMFNMGYLHQFGLGVEQNYEKAVDFYSVAVYMDGGDAAYNLAVLTMNGQGTARDMAKGIKYMEQSAMAGCNEAQLYLGTAFSMGYAGNPIYSNICRIPYHKPEQKYDFAAISGYYDGEELERIEEERIRAIVHSEIDAFRWIKLAADFPDENGESAESVNTSKYLLGLFYTEGIGCRMNRKLGLKYISEAALAGNEAAVAYLAEASGKNKK